MKTIEQCFHVVLFITLNKLDLTFKSLDKTLVCDHSNESCWAVHSCGIVYCAVKVALPFKSVDESLVCEYFQIRYAAFFFFFFFFFFALAMRLNV